MVHGEREWSLESIICTITEVARVTRIPFTSGWPSRDEGLRIEVGLSYREEGGVFLANSARTLGGGNRTEGWCST